MQQNSADTAHIKVHRQIRRTSDFLRLRIVEVIYIYIAIESVFPRVQMFNLDGTFITLATFSVAIIIVVLLKRYGQRDIDGRRAPCLPALPIVGSFPFFEGGLGESPKFFAKKAEILGPVFHYYAGSKLDVVLNGRTAVVEALVRQAEAFADRADFWTELNVLNVNRKGIGIANYGESFKQMHKLVLSILKEFGFGQVKETEHRILEELEVLLREIHEQNGRAFYPKSSIAMVSGNITNKILFGRQALAKIDSHTLVKAASEFVVRLEPKIDTAPIIRFLPKYRKMLADMVSAQTNMMELLKEAIKHSQSDDSETNFVKRYLKMAGPDYDHEDFIYLLRDLISASSDTVSSTIQWAMIELANHPQVQRRLQEEIDDLIPETRLPSLDDKPHLPYTEAVILESMRFHTLAPFAIPHRTYKETQICGYHIPKGCLVIPNIYSVHMDPKVWIDPENFRPERFFDKESDATGKYMVIPFSLGKRSCPGEIVARHELFLILTSLVQQFDIRPPEGQDSIIVEEEFTLTVRPKPFEIRMIPRKKA